MTVLFDYYAPKSLSKCIFLLSCTYTNITFTIPIKLTNISTKNCHKLGLHSAQQCECNERFRGIYYEKMSLNETNCNLYAYIYIQLHNTCSFMHLRM